MRVKLTIFILSAVVLGSSLLTSGHHPSFSKHPELKASAELVSKAIVPDEDFTWKKKSYQPYTVFLNAAHAKINAGRKHLTATVHFTKRSVKYFLLFRVLRN
jgi:hypothetical protein